MTFGNCYESRGAANPTTMFEPDVMTLMTSVMKGFCFVLTAMLIATLPWYQRFRDNRGTCDSTFDPCNLMLVNGTVSDIATNGEADVTMEMLPHDGVIDDLRGMHDRFRTAATTAAEICFGCFDFDFNNELQCGWHETIRLCAAMMMLCERVPPDINVAMAMSAARELIPVDTISKITLQSLRCLNWMHGDLRCLDGTRSENFDYSVDNLHETDWYEDTSMMIHSSFGWRAYGPLETELPCLTGSISAVWNQDLRPTTIVFYLVDDNNANMRFSWMQLFAGTLEYDPRLMILYRNLRPTIRLPYVGCEW